MPEGQLPIKTHKTSWVSADDATWMQAAVGTPAHFMAVSGGFGAACLVFCEMYGKSGFQATVITDGHYVTIEAMQAYKAILARLGLPNDVETILNKPNFRTIVKDANQRSNAIFS